MGTCHIFYTTTLVNKVVCEKRATVISSIILENVDQFLRNLSLLHL